MKSKRAAGEAARSAYYLLFYNFTLHDFISCSCAIGCFLNFHINQSNESILILWIVPVLFVVYAVVQRNVGHVVGHADWLLVSQPVKQFFNGYSLTCVESR